MKAAEADESGVVLELRGPESGVEHGHPASDGWGYDERPADPAIVPTLGPEFFFNRELSWLEFNERVLEEARDPSVPLLERLKFVAIASANLDEFFMVRVAGLLEQREQRVQDVPADGMSPAEQIAAISLRTHRMVDQIATTVRDELLPELASEGAHLVSTDRLTSTEREWVRRYFREQVLPVLTPLAIDPGHPFPHVRNKSLNLVALISGLSVQETQPAFAVVQVPSVLPRLVRIPSAISSQPAVFVLLEDVIADQFGELFPGFHTLGAWPFRVIRNFDLSLDEEEAEDLLESVEGEVRRRDRGAAVRLTVDTRCAPEALEMLCAALAVDRQFVFEVAGPLAVPDMTAIGEALSDRPKLKDEPFSPEVLPPLRGADDLFEVIRAQDVLLHHPYESFDPVVAFVAQAAEDPHVLAIKQTLYRTSGDSPIVAALARAAENGKQVTALIEIKARFDEENNILWARKLEEAGAHVVYGLVGLKTHAKTCLVVRREGDRLRRYVHLGTGNYNPHTARLYTDLSFFTAREEFGEDATSLFNLLTSCTAPRHWQRMLVAPLGLHERVLAMVERETAEARAGRPARILAKMNALVDPDVILALYRASQAGVEIDLIVRGICCLKPGLPGVSDRIRVRSIVDRFLEHSRVFYFEAGGAKEVYVSSADWMPRNFHRRVEAMFPIESDRLKKKILTEVFGLGLDDDVKARELLPDGTYRRVVRGEGVRSQQRGLELVRNTVRVAEERARKRRPFWVRPVRTRPTKDEAAGGRDAASLATPLTTRPSDPRDDRR